jgi:hypothetical protein
VKNKINMKISNKILQILAFLEHSAISGSLMEQQIRLKWGIYSNPRWVYIIFLGGGIGVVLRVVEFIPPPTTPLCIFVCPHPTRSLKSNKCCTSGFGMLTTGT